MRISRNAPRIAIARVFGRAEIIHRLGLRGGSRNRGSMSRSSGCARGRQARVRRQNATSDAKVTSWSASASVNCTGRSDGNGIFERQGQREEGRYVALPRRAERARIRKNRARLQAANIVADDDVIVIVVKRVVERVAIGENDCGGRDDRRNQKASYRLKQMTPDAAKPRLFPAAPLPLSPVFM